MSVTRPDLKCRHCRKNGRTRPRGLCYPCFGDPAIRRLYAVSKFAPARQEVPRANQLELVCDHCAFRYRRRFGEPMPPGWRRVPLDSGCGSDVVECPPCARAWDERWAC